MGVASYCSLFVPHEGFASTYWLTVQLYPFEAEAALLLGGLSWAIDPAGSNSVGSMHEFWNGLGDARGYVLGAVVTIFGVLLNVLALLWLERFRAKAQVKQAQQAWDREREARLEELRRQTYTQVVEICETRAFLANLPEDEQPKAITDWRGTRARVRFVTDDRRVIEAGDQLITRSVTFEEDRGKWASARSEFVRLCREELGLAELNIETAKKSNP